MRVNAVIDSNSAGSTVSSVINSRTWTLRLYCVPPPAAGVAVTLGRPAANTPHAASSSIANKILDTKRNMACLTQPCACAATHADDRPTARPPCYPPERLRHLHGSRRAPITSGAADPPSSEERRVGQ